MGKANKTTRKPTERAGKAPSQSSGEEPSRDPLRAFPADPPRRNLALLIVSAVLFVAWFCYLAYVALSG